MVEACVARDSKNARFVKVAAECSFVVVTIVGDGVRLASRARPVPPDHPSSPRTSRSIDARRVLSSSAASSRPLVLRGSLAPNHRDHRLAHPSSPNAPNAAANAANANATAVATHSERDDEGRRDIFIDVECAHVEECAVAERIAVA